MASAVGKLAKKEAKDGVAVQKNEKAVETRKIIIDGEEHLVRRRIGAKGLIRMADEIQDLIVFKEDAGDKAAYVPEIFQLVFTRGIITYFTTYETSSKNLDYLDALFCNEEKTIDEIYAFIGVDYVRTLAASVRQRIDHVIREEEKSSGLVKLLDKANEVLEDVRNKIAEASIEDIVREALENKEGVGEESGTSKNIFD